MQEQIEIKMLRLNTGEDIMGLVLLDDKHRYASIENPMRVILKRNVNKSQTMLLMAPWLPVEILEDNFATIEYSHILTIVEPKASLAEYYKNTVIQYNENIQHDLMEETDDMEFYNEEFDTSEEEDQEELFEAFKDIKKGTLH
jgi:hypothetical protein